MNSNHLEKISNDKATNYNVLDQYKDLTVGEIRNIVKQNSFPFAILMSQLQGDFNFGSVIRSANALGASEVFYYGRKQFDRRGALGCYWYSDVKFLHSFDEIKELKNKYSFVALENNINKNPISMFDFSWPKNSLICIGEERNGIEDNLLDLCDHFVEIPMAGSIRSFNASVAASIAMYDYRGKTK